MSTLKNTLLLTLLFSISTLTAATYCGETITSTQVSHKATITCHSLGSNVYQFIFESEDDFISYIAASNFYMNVNGAGGYQVSQNFQRDGKKLIATIESTSVPNIYQGDFFVIYSDGEARYNIPTDADFSQTCGTIEDTDTEKPVMTSAEVQEVGYNSVVLIVSATPAEKILSYIVKNSEEELGSFTPQDGLITITGLVSNTAYTLQVYAKKINGLVSDNYVDVNFTTSAISYCNFPIGHLGDANFGNANGRALITITKGATTNSFVLTLTPNYAAGATQSLDYMLVQYNNGASSASMGENKGVNSYDKLSVTLTYDREISTDNIRIFWSNYNWDGQWDSYEFTVDLANGVCTTEIEEPDPGPLPNTNLALNKQSYAGFSANGHEPNKANNGNLGDRWGCEGAQQEQMWWYVDLGDIYLLNNIQIWFETACPKSYILQKATTLPDDVANDDLWTTIYASNEVPHTGSAEENMNEYAVAGRAKYVRFKALECNNTQWGVSIFDFRVYGSLPTTDENDQQPVITTAEVVDIINNTQLQLKLTATDNEDGEVKIFRIINKETGKKYKLTADDNGYITIVDINNPFLLCKTYILEIQAMDNSGNYSEVNTLSVKVDILDDDFNIAAGGMASASKIANNDPNNYGASKALEYDNAGSYWASGAVGANEQVWWQVDLATTYRPNKIQVTWANSNPKLYYWEISTDGENYYPLSRNTTSPLSTDADNPQYVNYDITDNLPARFIRLRVDNTSGEVALRFVKVFAKCYSGDDKPIITYAELDNILQSGDGTTAYICLGAYDDITPFEQLKYKVDFIGEEGIVEKTIDNLTATDGLLTLNGLEKGATYTIRLYAIDADNNVSDNYKQIDFIADSKLSLYYLTGANLDGAYGVWSDALKSEESAAKRRFSYTDNAGIYRFSIEVAGGEEYRLYYDNENSIGSKFVEVADDWSIFGNKPIPQDRQGQTIVVYATDKNHFVSNFDYLFVYGEAAGITNKAEAQPMTYNAQTNQYTWEGDVVNNKTFNIVANAQQDAAAAEDRVISNQLFNLYATRAKLVFDVATWTATWTPINDDDPDICTQSGGPGSGFIYDGSCEFTDGYELKMYKATESSIQVTVTIFDNRVGLAKAYFRNYENYNPQTNSFEVREYPMNRINDNTFTLTLTPDLVDHRHENASQEEQEKYKIIPDWDKGTAIRYAVKFEFTSNENCTSGMSITGPDYYYMQVGCAPDTFYIYHKGQAPTENDIDEYEGTIIPQPIQYRRRFDLDTWYSIYFPFEVTRVAVYDEEDGEFYDLQPYYRDTDNGKYYSGHYIIRTPWPTDTRTIPIDNFEDKTGSYGWHDPETEDWLPQKNTPYIIQFHNDYYKDKWICFFSGEYTNIDENFSQGERPTDDETVTVYGNNIMMTAQIEGQSYHLSDTEWLRREEGVSINPFECYILANEITTARYKVIRRGAGEDIPIGGGTTTGIDGVKTDILLPLLRIYSATGVLLKEYRNTTFIDAVEHYQTIGSQGVYMFVSNEQTWKVMIGGR